MVAIWLYSYSQFQLCFFFWNIHNCDDFYHCKNPDNYNYNCWTNKSSNKKHRNKISKQIKIWTAHKIFARFIRAICWTFLVMFSSRTGCVFPEGLSADGFRLIAFGFWSYHWRYRSGSCWNPHLLFLGTCVWQPTDCNLFSCPRALGLKTTKTKTTLSIFFHWQR